MSKAAFWQRGETLDYKNGTTSVIEENTIVDITTRIGVTGTYINPGEVGSLHVVGVFEMPKDTTVAVTLGAELYFDGTNITTASTRTVSEETVNNTPAGYAVAAAAKADTVVLVKLLG